MLTLAATYALVWLTLAGYVGWMSSRQRRLIEQYTRLQKQFSEAESRAAEDHPSLRQVA
jgi:hypothetical protein